MGTTYMSFHVHQILSALSDIKQIMPFIFLIHIAIWLRGIHLPIEPGLYGNGV